MALLQELNEVPGGDSFANLYAKYDLLTQTINSILGGGTAGQYPSKVDGTDFNFVFTNPPIVKFKVVNIGDWDMDSTTFVEVLHGIVDYTKIRSAFIMILPDAGFVSTTTLFGGNNSESGTGISYFNATAIRLSRAAGGIFDNINYNQTSYNRGFVTIGYVD